MSCPLFLTACDALREAELCIRSVLACLQERKHSNRARINSHTSSAGCRTTHGEPAVAQQRPHKHGEESVRKVLRSFNGNIMFSRLKQPCASGLLDLQKPECPDHSWVRIIDGNSAETGAALFVASSQVLHGETASIAGACVRSVGTNARNVFGHLSSTVNQTTAPDECTQKP